MSINTIQLNLQQAKELEEKHLYEDAMQKYLQAAEGMLKLLKSEKDPDLKARLREKCTGVIGYCEEMKKLIPPKLAPTVVDKTFKYDDIIGLDNVKQVLRECTTLIDKHPELFVGVSPATRILLYGPPGTGKTMLARAMASESNRQFLSVSSADIITKWQGESEQNIRSLFTEARRVPSIIFFDEIDAFCNTRTDSETESTRRIKTELLIQLQGIQTDNQVGPIVLGATNTPWSLDSAFRRRFEKRIYIPLPDVEDRVKLLMFYLPTVEMDLFEIHRLAARMELCTSSDIANLCNEAKMIPIRRVQQAEKFRLRKGMYHVYTEPESSDIHNHDSEEESDQDVEGTDPVVIENLKFTDIPPGRIVPPKLTLKDFEQLLETHKPSISTADIRRFIEWERSV